MNLNGLKTLNCCDKSRHKALTASLLAKHGNLTLSQAYQLVSDNPEVVTSSFEFLQLLDAIKRTQTPLL